MTVEKVFERFSGYLSNELMMRTLISIFAVCLGCFLLAGLLRLITGKNGTAVGSVSVALDVIILYLLTTLLPMYLPAVTSILPALPFVSIESGILALMPIPELSREILSLQLINLFLIAFLFGLADVLLPEGRNIVIWILLRAVTILLIFTCIWFLNKLNESLVPDYIQTYAPIILLILIALLLALTVFKWLFGLILGISCGPVAGAVYTFIISNTVGKQLAKASFTCVLLMLLLLLAYRVNTLTINVSSFPSIINILTLLVPLTTRYLVSKLFRVQNR